MKNRRVADTVGTHDWLFIVLDALRYDVAMLALERGLTPHLAAYLPHCCWERRESPATFTYPAHHAFFAGFLPTQANPSDPLHPEERLFASAFLGSETTGSATWQFEQATVIEALAVRGYHTVCIGGVGFFNKQNAIGSVLPDLFMESHWRADMGVTCKDSTANQVALVHTLIAQRSAQERLLLFINVSALHQPNYFYSEGATSDSIETQVAALAYVDQQLASLFASLKQRAPTFAIICADHGTCYGEAGYVGHRVVHEKVLTVPYAHFFL